MNVPMNMKQSFLNEVDELLDRINESILALEESPDDREKVNHVFRAAHTLKGSANLYGYSGIAVLTHLLEGVLDELRGGIRVLEPALTDVLLESFDQIRSLAEGIRSGEEDPQSDPDILQRLQQIQLRGGSEESESKEKRLFSDDPKEWAAAARSYMNGDKELYTFAHLFAVPTPTDKDAVKLDRYQARQMAGILREVQELKGVEQWGATAMDPFERWIGKLTDMAARRKERHELQGVFLQLMAVFVLIQEHARRCETGNRYPAWWKETWNGVERAISGWLEGNIPETLPDIMLDVWELCRPKEEKKQEFGILLAPELEEGFDDLFEEETGANPGKEWASSAGMAGASAAGSKEPLNRGSKASDSGEVDRGELLPLAPQSRISEAVKEAMARKLVVEQIHFLAPKGKPLIERWELARKILLKCAEELGDSALADLAGQSSPVMESLKRKGNEYSDEGSAPGREEPAGPVAVVPLSKEVVREEKAAPLLTSGRDGQEEAKPDSEKLIRVETSKVERLMELIGELSIVKNSFPFLIGNIEEGQDIARLRHELKEKYAMIDRIAKGLQDAIVDMRMLPVSNVFSRFNRFVRDMARQSGKQIRLEFAGEETTLDKTLVEALLDPLIHLIRNAIDHGIEPVGERLRKGKPEEGLLAIRASREGSRIVLEVADDGRGIDANRIRERLIGQGLLERERAMNLQDQDVLQYIFQTGFSTAEEITSLSGRGVGMDVVRSTVAKLQGDVRVDSHPGHGTTVTIELPLSLSMTQVLKVQAGNQFYGIPLDQIEETVRMNRSELRTMQGSPIVVLRNRICPVISLVERFRLKASSAGAYLYMILLKNGHVVVVDSFAGQQEVVIVPLEDGLKHLDDFAGASILGDGSVMLILSGNGLVARGGTD
jgi:two-component system chemotaxis sensor kinase CheA